MKGITFQFTTAQGLMIEYKKEKLSNSDAFKKCHGPCALVELMVMIRLLLYPVFTHSPQVLFNAAKFVFSTVRVFEPQID